MPDDQLQQLNEQLADPPLANAGGDGHIGLFAVAHLAARHGIRVAFAQPPDGGTTVLVHIPAALIARAARPVGPSPDSDPEPVTGTDTAMRPRVALLGAPLPQAGLVHGPMVHRSATATASAQIARTRLTSFQQGSRRARAEAQVVRNESSQG
ncbi:MAG: ATP-binding protein [Streptosporangiaceae bacterium]